MAEPRDFEWFLTNIGPPMMAVGLIIIYIGLLCFCLTRTVADTQVDRNGNYILRDRNEGRTVNNSVP